MSLITELRRKRIPFGISASNSAEITLCCPFCVQRGHTADTEFKLGVNVKNGKGHCFRCDWKSQRSHWYLARALDLGELNFGDFVHEEEKQVEQKELKLPPDFTRLWYRGKRPKGFLYEMAFNYLIERRVSLAQIEKHKIGVSFVGEFAYRIIFPVYQKGELIGIVARDFTDNQKAKYKNSVGKKYLYNLKSRHKRRFSAILCEGIFDCLALERTFPQYDVIALLGHSLSEDQISDLTWYHKLVFWCDPDRVGIKAFLSLAEQFVVLGSKVFVITPHPSKDAGSMTTKELVTRFENKLRKWSPVLSLRLRNTLNLRLLND